MNNFSVRDYFKMAKARGIWLPIQYFIHNHMFDILNGTDTHSRLEKKNYIEQPLDFEDGVLYMSCPTGEVKKALKWLMRVFGDSFYNFQFCDLGCGKGKSLLLYTKLCGRKAKYKAIGIEYYRPLVIIAEENFRQTGTSNYLNIFNDDARKFKSYINTNNLIFYLYNPFTERVLKDVLYSCKDMKVILIYTDPIYDETIRKMGFRLLNKKLGYFPNRNTFIYSSFKGSPR